MLWFGKKSKQNIADAVKCGQTITNTHAEEIRQIEKKQKNLAEENAEIQGVMLEHMKQQDIEIEQLKSYILNSTGLVENADTSMMTAFTSKSQTQITTVMDDSLNRYNVLTNVSKMVIDEKTKYAIADLLAVTTERAMNAKFHSSLNELEKCGILSEEKYNMHVRNVQRAKGAINIGTNIVFDIAPLICDYCNTRIQQKKLKEFIVGSVAYINRETNPLIYKHIWETLMQAGVVKTNAIMDRNFINKEFDKYANSDGIYVIPMLENKIKTNISQEEIMAKKVVSICDLDNAGVRERALEFLESFIRIGHQEAEVLLADAQCSQHFLSEVILYSSINYQTIFSDFTKDISHAVKFSEYDLSNDVQKKIRDSRKDTMEQIIRDTLQKKGPLFRDGKRRDIIEANARVMSSSLNPYFDSKTSLKLIKRNRKVGEYLGLL